ncbi:protein translocase subunit SecD [Desulforhabdus amnigena]|nr:protein translocase subunit SecD [Desulforhabdus amnigena]
MKNLQWRTLMVVAILIAGIVYLVPTLSSSLPSWWTKIFPTEKIHLGLDLQGGMHLVLEVESDKAVESTLERLAEDLKETLREQHVAFTQITRAKDLNIEIQLPGVDQQNQLKDILDKDFPTLEWKSGETGAEGMKVTLAMKPTEVERTKKMAVAQGLETIRNRIDQFGVSEPDIRPEGEDRILIQLPGVKEPQRAVALIGKTALLEFKLVAEGVTPQDIKDGKIPAGVKVYTMKREDKTTGQTYQSQIALKDRTLMTGEYITNAQVQIDTQYNTPYVSLTFDQQGGRIFERVTEANVKKQLAIVLDGVVYSAPVIQEKISGGRASITGSFSMEEARDLAIVLRAGALPAPVKILEQRTVGPALGKDSIQKGLLACLVGGISIIFFMVIYYKLSGVVADVALVMNIILILAGLAAFGATLTLPGIAGIALTIGMAVDANVLIYERIREEMRLGKTPRAALDAGYSKATVTIIDANITTLIAALVLFQFGTGPIRGFAVTLSIGLVANLFTAIVVTRIIFDYLLSERRMRTLSI